MKKLVRLFSNEYSRNAGKFILPFLLMLLIAGAFLEKASAQTVLFSQDFASATTVTLANNSAVAITTSTGNNIVGTTAASQFTSITCNAKSNCGIGINDATHTGKFFAGGSNTSFNWSLVKNTNFAATAPTAVKVEITAAWIVGSSSSNVAGVDFAIGSGFSNGYTTTEPATSAVHSGFTFQNNSTSKVAVYGTPATTLSSSGVTQTTSLKLTWIINNSGSTLSYTNPNGTTSTLAADKWDLWQGTTQFVTAAAALTGSVDLQNLYIGNVGGKNNNITIDDIKVTDMTPATTPPTISAVANQTVDNNFNITFTDDATWRGAVTGIKVDGTSYTSSAYTLSSGSLVLNTAAITELHNAGSHTVVVAATGYSNASVTQSNIAGNASILAITTQPGAPGSNGGLLSPQPVIKIQDQYGNATTSTASVTASVGAGTWTLGGTATINAVSGTATFSGLTATSAAAVTGATIKFSSSGLPDTTSSGFNIPTPAGSPAPSLTAAAGATVDNNFTITFSDDAIWRGNISAVTVGSNVLPSAVYDATVAGQLTLKPSQSSFLQTAGTYTITVSSSGYSDAVVSQSIGAGVATKLGVSTQPTAAASNGGLLSPQPVIRFRDQYNNITTSSANVTAVANGGSWNIGGTTTATASSGVATFTNLTAGTTGGTLLNGAVITFSSAGLTDTVSTGFTIPAYATSSTDQFRSNVVSTGNWSNAGSWQSSPAADGVNWYTATAAPTSAASSVTIRNGHTISFDASATTAATTIQNGGRLDIASAKILTLGANMLVDNGAILTLTGSTASSLVTTGKVLTVLGTLSNANTASAIVSSAGTLLFATASDTGNYTLTGAGVQIPVATWVNGSNYSTIYYNSSGTASIGSSQTYGDWVIGTGAGSKVFNSTGSPYTVRDLTVKTAISQLTTGTPVVINVTRDFTQDIASGSLLLMPFNSSIGVITLNVSGNFNITRGTFSASTVNAGNISNLNIGGNFSVANGATFTQAAGDVTVTFNGSSAQTLSNAGTMSGSFDYTVNNAAGVTFNNNVVADTLTVASGVLSLGTSGNTASSLILGTKGTTNATWGSTSSSASFKNDTYFGSTGLVTVSTNRATTPTVTVTPGTYTYTGSSQGPGASVTSNTGTSTNYTFSYVGTGGTTYSASATPPTNAGTYTVTATVAASSDGFYNSASSSATAFSIGKAALTITAGDQSVTYGTSAATVTGNGTYTPSGFKGSDNASVISGSATYTTNYTPTTAVGASGITITPVVSGLSAANYSFTTANGTITVTGLSQTTADYRSNGSGNFSSASTWQYFDGSNWQTATQSPGTTNNITVQNGNDIVLDVDYTVGSGKTFALSATSTLTINSTVTLTTVGTADFGDQHVTLKSNASGTAAIGKITGTLSNATNVTVERYIPSNGTRAWRLLSIPTSGTQSINEAWQESQANITHYGTIITAGPANNSDWASKGFDAVQDYGSILSYNQNGNSWDQLTSTLGEIDNQQGYFLYVRGDRTVGPSSSTSTVSSTTLRTTGALYQGNQTTSVPATKYALLGNKYAASINFINITKDGSIDNSFIVWDPKLLLGGSLGHYQTFSSTTSPPWMAVPGGGSYGDGISPFPNTYIESGQAFFVHSTGVAGNVTLTENSKVGAQVNAVFRPVGDNVSGQLITNLYAKTVNAANLSDVNVVAFNSSYSNNIDVNDVIKFPNSGENIGVVRDGKILWIEGRQDIAQTDTIFFALSNLKQQTYELVFNPSGLNVSGLTASLQDAYLGTSTPISLSAATTVSFTVNNNAASAASNRLRIVLDNGSTTVPVTFINVSASQKDAGVQVAWNVTAQTNVKQYVVETSADGAAFTDAATITAKTNANGTVSYNWIDVAPQAGNNYYRIKSVDMAGDVKYSDIVKVNIGNSKPDINIYFATGAQIGLKLINQPAGKYSLKLMTIAGQELFATTISHAGGSTTQTVNTPNVAKGVYQLEIVAPGKVYSQKISIR